MSMNLLRIVWFGALALSILTFIYYSVAVPALFGEKIQQAWQWLLPNILPPIGAVFGIQIAEHRASDPNANEDQGVGKNENARRTSPRIALAFSLLFVVALFVSIFGVPMSEDPLAFLNMTNYWLAPLLGFAMATLGAVFAGSIH